MLILGIVIVILFILASMPVPNSLSDNSMESENINKESFMGGYYIPYDYPFYYPMFYTGCNEDVFGNIGCAW